MKKIAMSIIFASLTLIAAAQSSVTVSIYNGPGVTCCPIVTSLNFIVLAGCTFRPPVRVPVPPCGAPPVTYNASALCTGCTDIIAVQATIIGSFTPTITIGDNTPPCSITPYTPDAGGGGGVTGVCQWEAIWQYVSGPTAVLTIHT
ncbi:MAG TPA: hypothetical protein VN721_17200 [Flavipsychrobacter sp.]|nr:hypothetical protein [Flavipsychrobacter sp.]